MVPLFQGQKPGCIKSPCPVAPHRGRVLGGRRREAFERMRAAGIGVQVNYLPVYWHPVYARLGYRRGTCPNAEAFYEQELSLPMFPGLTDDDVDRVAETLAQILR